MDLYDLGDLARAYARMGDAVAEQMEDLLIRWDIPALIEEGELNPNALPLMLPYLEAAAGLGADDAQEAVDLIQISLRQRQEAPR